MLLGLGLMGFRKLGTEDQCVVNFFVVKTDLEGGNKENLFLEYIHGHKIWRNVRGKERKKERKIMKERNI